MTYRELVRDYARSGPVEPENRVITAMRNENSGSMAFRVAAIRARFIKAQLFRTHHITWELRQALARERGNYGN